MCNTPKPPTPKRPAPPPPPPEEGAALAQGAPENISRKTGNRTNRNKLRIDLAPTRRNSLGIGGTSTGVNVPN